eukprot:SAG31_NODE_5468_length_2521_cov_8.738233_1_plen_486_part_00
MPWIVAGGGASGLSFGVFDNTMGFTFGTASSANQTLEFSTTFATHIDIIVITWPANTTAGGSARADAIMGGYADALGHVPVMPKEVVGYWHSKNTIWAQEEAEWIVGNMSARGLHVDVLVLDLGYKACDGCTAFAAPGFVNHLCNQKTALQEGSNCSAGWPDPTGMVAKFKANGTFVMAHVNIDTNTSSPFFLGGADFTKNSWFAYHLAANNTLHKKCMSDANGKASDVDQCRYNVFDEKARAAKWRSVKATLVKAGITMFWLDDNEPIGSDVWETPTAPLDGKQNFLSKQVKWAASKQPPPDPPGGTCTVELLRESRTGSCNATTFGCSNTNGTMWVSGACAGVFKCNAYTTGCFTHKPGTPPATCPCFPAGTGPYACQDDGTNCPVIYGTNGRHADPADPSSFESNQVLAPYYPYYHALAFAEGIAELRAEGLSDPAMLLIRATTPGSWRLGAAAWDGDHGGACKSSPVHSRSRTAHVSLDFW